VTIQRDVVRDLTGACSVVMIASKIAAEQNGKGTDGTEKGRATTVTPGHHRTLENSR